MEKYSIKLGDEDKWKYLTISKSFPNISQKIINFKAQKKPKKKIIILKIST
jgi:hypothetical protein